MKKKILLEIAFVGLYAILLVLLISFDSHAAAELRFAGLPGFIPADVIVKVHDKDSQKFITSVLTISRVAGGCEMHKRMIDFQNTEKMSGGADFLESFINSEAARFEKTPEVYLKWCITSIEAYTKLRREFDARLPQLNTTTKGKTQ